jgi:hypothetical protein
VEAVVSFGDACAFAVLGVIVAAGVAGFVAAWRSEQADRRDQ